MMKTCNTCEHSEFDNNFLEYFCQEDPTNIAMITLGWEGKCPYYKEGVEMDINEKFAKVIDQTMDFKGVTVRSPKHPEEILCLDDKEEHLEIGIHCTAMNSATFMYLIGEMLKNGEVELKFNPHRPKTEKHLGFLHKLEV